MGLRRQSCLWTAARETGFMPQRGGTSVKSLPANAGDLKRRGGSSPGREDPYGGGQRSPIPVFLPGESSAQRSLAEL